MDALFAWLQSGASDSLGNQIYKTLFAADRWKMYLGGLGITFQITIGAILIGTVLGIITALFSISKPRILKAIARVYTTIIRGTPTTVQLLIMYNVILVASTNKVLIATLTFGINSGAYIAEIFRGGIMSVDKGQIEAGRSLGLHAWQTMLFIVLPQALKNCLPTYTSEFIVLIKETSIVGYIALNDITKIASVIANQTYSALVPLVVAALVYLAITCTLTWLFGLLERRLRASDLR